MNLARVVEKEALAITPQEEQALRRSLRILVHEGNVRLRPVCDYTFEDKGIFYCTHRKDDCRNLSREEEEKKVCVNPVGYTPLYAIGLKRVPFFVYAAPETMQ